MELYSQNRQTIVISLITLVHFIISSWYAYNTVLFSDGTLHTLIINEIMKKGNIPKYVPNMYSSYAIPYFMQPRVYYPPLYYVLGFLFQSFVFEKNIVYWIGTITSTLTIPFAYFIGKKIFDENVGLFFALVVGLNQGLMLDTGSQKIVTVFLGFAILYLYLKYIDEPTKPRLFLFSLMVATSLGISQSMYFYVLAIFIHLFAYRCVKGKPYNKIFKEVLALAMVVMILFIPILSWHISTSGTVVAPKITKWPIVDEYVFHPHYLNLPEWQVQLNEKVNVRELEMTGGRTYNRVHPSPVTLLVNEPISFVNNYLNPYSQSYLPKSLVFIPFNAVFLVLIVMGILLFLRKINIRQSVFIFVTLVGFFPVWITHRINLSWFIPFLLSIVIALSLDWFRKVFPKCVLVAILLLVVVASIGGSVLYVYCYRDFGQTTFFRTKIPGGYRTLLEVADWINQRTLPIDKVMAANLYELAYYSKKTVFWDWRLFFLSKDDVLYYLRNYEKPKYIVTLDYQIAEDWDFFLEIPYDSPFLELLKNRSIFKEVYDKNTVHIYEFIDGGNGEK